MALQRVTIGFAGNQVLPFRLEEASLNALLQALAGGGWHDLTVEDGTLRLNLAEVIYVRTALDEHKVGFGAGG